MGADSELMATVLARVQEKWRASSVPLNPGASATELNRLRDLLGIELPADVQRFYAVANGMADHAGAGVYLVSFWSIDRICREQDVCSGSDAMGAFADVAFADVLIYSWCFRFRVRAQRLHVVADGQPWEFDDFSSFLHAYLTKPQDLGVQ